MKTRKKKFAVLFILCCFISLLAFPARTARAAADILPEASDNIRIGLQNLSNLTATDNGYMRVFFNKDKISIEYYDNDFNIQSKKSLALELEGYGGFYAGSDAYYIVEGQPNIEEKDTAEVIRVLKYDTDWNKLGTAAITSNPKLFGGEVRFPFNYGCVEMTEYNGTLYIVTGHEGYVDPAYNQGHQGFLMIAVDEASMTGEIVSCDLWHSFSQYIACKDSSLYVLELSEGSRCTALSKYNTTDFESTTVPVLKYGGSRDSAWAIKCYASVDGMALSSTNVLGLGTSIDQSKYDSVSSDTAHNIYLTVTPMAGFSKNSTTSVKWLTDYSGDGKCFLGTKITKITDDRFMISWEEANLNDADEEETKQPEDLADTLSVNTLHYIFVDGDGNTISQEFTAAAAISDCQPIVKDGRIVYFASSDNTLCFYSIDAQTGQFSKKVHRSAGENASWELKKGVLTISGTGAISVDTEAKYRDPLSSTAGTYVYSSSDNSWKPIRSKVTKLIIKSGITSIPDQAFEFFTNLKEAVIYPGLESIGKEAFHRCEALEKITIPSSVKSIGKDCFWTGYFLPYDNDRHVVDASIYAPSGSYAINYAKKNHIDYYYSDAVDISKAKVSGLKKKYEYNGQACMPKVKVKLNGKTLKQDKDYIIIYSNNYMPGKAVIEITGINKYKGTLKKTFKIVWQ